MTLDDAKEQLLLKLRGLRDLLEDEEVDQALTDALAELGLEAPPSSAKASYWFLRRAYRHAINLMLTESAHKFKYKQINLQNRFEHSIRIVEKEDKDWKENENDVLLEMGGNPASSEFGSYVRSGLRYKQYGRAVIPQKASTEDVYPNDET